MALSLFKLIYSSQSFPPLEQRTDWTKKRQHRSLRAVQYLCKRDSLPGLHQMGVGKDLRGCATNMTDLRRSTHDKQTLASSLKALSPSVVCMTPFSTWRLHRTHMSSDKRATMEQRANKGPFHQAVNGWKDVSQSVFCVFF